VLVLSEAPIDISLRDGFPLCSDIFYALLPGVFVSFLSIPRAIVRPSSSQRPSQRPSTSADVIGHGSTSGTESTTDQGAGDGWVHSFAGSADLAKDLGHRFAQYTKRRDLLQPTTLGSQESAHLVRLSQTFLR
jgi:hypothetical protein